MIDHQYNQFTRKMAIDLGFYHIVDNAYSIQGHDITLIIEDDYFCLADRDLQEYGVEKHSVKDFLELFRVICGYNFYVKNKKDD